MIILAISQLNDYTCLNERVCKEDKESTSSEIGATENDNYDNNQNENDNNCFWTTHKESQFQQGHMLIIL